MLCMQSENVCRLDCDRMRSVYTFKFAVIKPDQLYAAELNIIESIGV